MATVSRIAATTLNVGESVSGSWTPTGDISNIAVAAVQVGTVTSQVRIIARDGRGLTLASDILVGTDTNRLEPLEGLDGAVTVEIVCMLGTAVVSVVEISGATAFGSIVTADCTAPLLSADAAGRALMADDYFRAAEFAAGAGGKFAANALATAGIANLFADDAFTAAEFAAGAGGKFAANCLVTAGLANLISDDAFTAAEFAAGAGGKFAANCLVSAGIQNLFAAGSMDGAACVHLFPAGAIPVAAVAAAPLAIETVIADPGVGADIVVTGSGHCNINIAGPGDDRGLPIPTIDGQALLIVHTAGANAGTVTSAQALDPQGTTVLNFAAELGQWILLIARSNGAALRWQVVAQGGGVATSTPVYGPLAIADPTAGNYVASNNNGRCTFQIINPADDIQVADPIWEGQVLVLESVAASAAGTVTFDSPFNDLGATVLNFNGGVNERVWLVGELIAGALEWRIANEDKAHPVSRNVPDPGDGAYIDAAAGVLHDNALCIVTHGGGGAETRLLADPLFVGQKLTVIQTVGGAATLAVVGDNDLDTAAHDTITFTAADGQMVVFEAVDDAGALEWRVASNPAGLVIN